MEVNFTILGTIVLYCYFSDAHLLDALLSNTALLNEKLRQLRC